MIVLQALAATSAHAEAPRTVHVQVTEIVDSGGVGPAMPALLGFLPVGWKAEGGISRIGRNTNATTTNANACSNGYDIRWRASSADGSASIAVFPPDCFGRSSGFRPRSWSSYEQSAYLSVERWIEQNLPKVKPGARKVEYRQRPDLVAVYADLAATEVKPDGARTSSWVDAGEMLFAYVEQGREMRGILVARGFFTSSSESPRIPEDRQSEYARIEPGWLVTAPAALLNSTLSETLRQSFLADPAWRLREARRAAQTSEADLKLMEARADEFARAPDHLARIVIDRNAVRADLESRLAAKGKRLGSQSREPSLPRDRILELTSLYANVWQLTDGSYVLSEDPQLDPQRVFGLAGRKLEMSR